jgi:acyl-CoA dehydrogenase
MDEQQQLIIETAKRIFADQCDKTVVDKADFNTRGEQGEFPSALWQTLTETGLTAIGTEEGGGTFTDALLVLREAGAAAAPIPLAEHLIALQLLQQAGQAIPEGIITVAALTGETVCGARFTEAADWLLVAGTDELYLLNNQSLSWQISASIAGETTAELAQLPELQSPIALSGAADQLRYLGARTRVSMMAGALSEVLAMSVQYVSDREQFGRSLSKFQAIQQQLAVMAGEVAACQRAAAACLISDAEHDVAIGKARLGQAVAIVTDYAHQVHGAIGYTLEHALNHRTRRLWQWRDEYGAERYWQIQLGRQFCAAGADQLWAGVTAAG